MKKLLLFVGAVIATSVATVLTVGFQATPVMAADCGGVETAYIDCGDGVDNSTVETSAIWRVLEIVLNIMIGGVAIAAVGGIVYAAIIYASAQDNASQVSQAKEMIRNVIIGLALFIAMWAGLQYLIPGGVL